MVIVRGEPPSNSRPCRARFTLASTLKLGELASVKARFVLKPPLLAMISRVALLSRMPAAGEVLPKLLSVDTCNVPGPFTVVEPL